jgi:DNA primase
MSLWDSLASEDQAMLCALPDPHGPLFAWMESQFHEHGPLGASALLELMQEEPFAAAAETWAQAPALQADVSAEIAPQEAREELRRLLNLMHIDRLKQLETEALEQAQIAQDPQALERWRSLHERRRELMAQTKSIAG